MSQNWSGDIWSNILWLVILSPSSSDLKDIEIFWYILKYHNIIIRLYWKALNTNNSSKTLWFFLFKKYRQSRMIYAHFHQNPSDTFTCVLLLFLVFWHLCGGDGLHSQLRTEAAAPRRVATSALNTVSWSCTKHEYNHYHKVYCLQSIVVKCWIVQSQNCWHCTLTFTC